MGPMILKLGDSLWRFVGGSKKCLENKVPAQQPFPNRPVIAMAIIIVIIMDIIAVIIIAITINIIITIIISSSSLSSL